MFSSKWYRVKIELVTYVHIWYRVIAHTHNFKYEALSHFYETCTGNQWLLNILRSLSLSLSLTRLPTFIVTTNGQLLNVSSGFRYWAHMEHKHKQSITAAAVAWLWRKIFCERREKTCQWRCWNGLKNWLWIAPRD